MVGLLSTPLERYEVVTVLGLAHYPSVLGLLRPAMRREMATKIVQVGVLVGVYGGWGWILGCGGGGGWEFGGLGRREG